VALADEARAQGSRASGRRQLRDSSRSVVRDSGCQAGLSRASRVRALLVAIPSLSLVVAMAIGLPAFLWNRFGSPNEVAQAAWRLVSAGHGAAGVAVGDPDRVIAGLLAAFCVEVAWAGWLWITICLLRALTHLIGRKSGPPPRMGGAGPVIFMLVCLISSALLWTPGTKTPRGAAGMWAPLNGRVSLASFHQERRSRSLWSEAPAAIVGGAIVLALDRLRLIAKRGRMPKEKLAVADEAARRAEHEMRSGVSLELLDCFWHRARLVNSTEDPWIWIERNSSCRDAETDYSMYMPRSSEGLVDAPCFVLGDTREMVLGCRIDHLGGLAVVSEPALCEGLIRAIGLQLACWPGAQLCEIVLVGFDWLQDAGGLQVRFAKELSEVATWLAKRSLDLRVGEAGPKEDLSGGSEEVVVVMGYFPSDEELRILSRIAADGSRGVHVVTGASETQLQEITRPGWVVLHQSSGEPRREDPTWLELPNGRGCFNPLVFDEQVAGVIAKLLSSASLSSERSRDRQGSGAPSESFAEERCVADDEIRTEFASMQRNKRPAECDSGAEVIVCVLGPVSIEGGERSFTRSWAFELVVYLAMHKGGVSNDIWATALWPDKVLSPATMHSTVSVARRCLGRGSDGEDHLPHSHGKLWLRPTVTTDYERFCSLSQSENPLDWEAALALVRGEPFQGLRAGDWAIVEGFVAEIETQVVDLAERLATWQLGRGNARAAQWAARQGLKASKYDERLYRLLMLAADALGHPQGVESVFRELVTLVAEDLEPFDAVHPETVQLYRGLSRRGKLVAR
jgi:DNA-binding SARP family transcriptional activator